MPEQIEKRTRNSKTHSLGGRKFSWDGTIGSIHYEDNGWQEIDSYFEPAIAPWDWQMLKAGYHIRVKEDFTAGQIIEFEVQGETVQFQPMALEWTNDLDQIQPISMPQSVSPVVSNPEVDLLPAVGMPSHQGTIRWNDAYGQGIDFEWKATSTRLNKILEIENLNKLPAPQQYILDGGTPVLRLNLIFDPSGSVDIYVDGELWNKSAKKQTFKMIEFRKDGEVLWGFMPLRYWDSDEDNKGQSVATLEKRGNKLYISIRVPYSWLQSAIYPIFIDTDVNEQVLVGADDGYSQVGGKFNATDVECNVGSKDHDNDDAVTDSWARFPGVVIPNGATVGANSYFSADFTGGQSVSSVVSKVSADDQADPSAPSNQADHAGRDRTTAGIDWDGWPGFDFQDSPSIQLVIQELVDSYDYSAGKAIMVFLDDDGSGVDTYWRYRAYEYDDNTYAPKLHIEYEVGQTYERSAALDVGIAPSADRRCVYHRYGWRP